jgi:hypothetical protein
MNKLRRIQHDGWFIQSQLGQTGRYIAWASKTRTRSPIDGADPVYFNFGDSEIEAIDKVIDELKGVKKDE